MPIFSKDRFASLFGGEYSLDLPDSSLNLESFTYQEMNYIRTPSAYYCKPVYKRLWSKTSQSNFEYNRSCYKTQIARSQAKGLLKYTQLEFDL